MRFKALLTLLAIPSLAHAAPVVDTTPVYVSGNGQPSHGYLAYPKTPQMFVLDYDFTNAVLGSYNVWGFIIDSEAGPGGPIASYYKFFDIDPLQPGTMKGRISQPFGINKQANGEYSWSIPSTVDGDFRLSIHSVGAVPEPETWAIMILGFGAIGFAMRRKTMPPRPSW